jgi:hypothetical protein
MPKIFEQTRYRKPNYSAFDLSREQKLSCKMGELVPTYLEEVVPGDHFKVNTEIMLRLAPMLAPIMHRVDVYMHYFFVPNRIIWNQWETFITGGREGTSSPTYPTVAFGTGFRDSKLPDYLGIPTYSTANANIKVSQLPFRAYQKIWNDYYRDPNIEQELDINGIAALHTGTASPSVLYDIRIRSWEKDYFSSALPWTQRGPEVSAPVNLEYKSATDIKTTTGGIPTDGSVDSLTGVAQSAFGEPVRFENIVNDSLEININELRRTTALQRWLEKMATGGARYYEQLQSMFGVKSQDQRLQRAEYLGGGKQPIVISEVLNTTGTEDAPQGDMTGHGISVGSTNSFEYHVPEHGWIMGILSILPKATYQQGIHRHWLRTDKLDYYWPEFAHLGEQEIYNYELYLDTLQTIDQNRETFGYQQRYAEYKYGQSTVHGDFRNTLNYWHMGRIFSTRPALNTNFLRALPDTSEMVRPFAVQEGDKCWIQLYHDVKARRPMPYFADPRLS